MGQTADTGKNTSSCQRHGCTSVAGEHSGCRYPGPFRDSGVVVMLIAMALVGLCLQVPIAIAFGRRTDREGAAATEKVAL